MTTLIEPPFTSTGAGKSNPFRDNQQDLRRSLRQFVKTQSIETPSIRISRLAGLLTELDDIDADRKFAYQFAKSGTWLGELTDEEHDVWDRLAELLSS